MCKPFVAVGLLTTCVLLLLGPAAPKAQAPTSVAQPASTVVDFVRDVQPILRQSCYGCHGPSQQMNGFRLDRRRDAMRGGTATQIGPGNSEGSRLYLRLIGDEFGQQMPPTGALAPPQVATIKAWIDQGAPWPDEASGDVVSAPADPGATRLMSAIRDGDLRAARAQIKAQPEAVTRRGPHGATALICGAVRGRGTRARATRPWRRSEFPQ